MNEQVNFTQTKFFLANDCTLLGKKLANQKLMLVDEEIKNLN